MDAARFFRRCAAVSSVAVSGLMSLPAGAAVLQVNGAGILTGASGIVVGGFVDTYSVTFVEGTCASVFGSCAPASFVFSTSSSAVSASQALLDEVFIDGLPGLPFDEAPQLTAGCSSVSTCNAMTPWGVDGLGTVLFGRAQNNSAAGPPDAAFGDAFSDGTQTGNLETVVWAVWRADGTVDEPGSLALLGLSGAALAWAQRRRRHFTQVQ